MPRMNDEPGKRVEDRLMLLMQEFSDSLEFHARERKAASKDMHEENLGHLSKIENDIAEIRAGFPDGDPAEHREYHEALIAKVRARKLFWEDLHKELLRKGIWGALLFTGAALVYYLKTVVFK